MDPIYTVIIAILAVLAVSGLFVGVTNDAVNFLNSAIGSKAAPRRVILIVASIGILVGTLTSSGMMEVARNGMFDPGMFSFHEVILLYLSVMFANIILTSTIRGGFPPRPPCRSSSACWAPRSPFRPSRSPAATHFRWETWASSSTRAVHSASSRRSCSRWSSR